MYRFLLKPKWLAFHLLVIVLVVTMVSLGFWQLRRLHERRDFNAVVNHNTEQPVASLAAVLTPGVDIGTVEWRRVEATGTYLPGKEVQVVNRSQGGQPGANIVDALLLADGTVLLVNRGFVPSLDQVPPAPTGTVTVTGRLRRSETRHIGQPEDASGVVLTQVHRIEIAKLAPQIGKPVEPMYLEMLGSQPADGKVLQPVEFPALDEGPHLSYAIQWFIFSTCAIVGWVLAVRRHSAELSGKRSKKSKRRRPPPIADELSRV